MKVTQSLGHAGIHVYKNYISEDYNNARQSRCMFSPTCSSYAQEAVAKLGPVDGLRQGFDHLGQCNTKHHAEQLSAFLGLLGQPGPAPAVTFESPQVESQLRQLEGEVERLAAQAKNGPSPQLQSQFGHVVAQMQENLHVATIEHPGQKPEGFYVSASLANAPLRPLQDRNWFQTGLASVSGAVLATIGAAAGGLFLLAIGQGFKAGASQGFAAGKILGRNLADRASGVDKLPNNREPLQPLAGKDLVRTDLRQQITETSGLQHWSILSLVDATSSDLEAQRTRKVIDMQNAADPTLEVLAELRRVGRTPEQLRGRAVAQFAGAGAVVAASVGLDLLLGASGFGLALGGVGSLLTAGSLVSRGVGNLHAARAQPQVHQEEAWTGTRTYALDGSLKNEGAIVTPSQNTLKGTEAPDAEHILPLLQKASDRPLIVNLDGHGKDNRTVGGVEVSELGEALRQSPHKAEAVVLEACHTADLDNLRYLSCGAKVAVVSQDSMWEAGLPWAYMTPRMEEMGADGPAWATALVNRHGGNDYVTTLSAVDLDRVEDLGKSVDHLKDSLESAWKNGHKREILRAKDMTTKFSRLGQQTHNPAQWIFKATEMEKDGDLGSWLLNLERSCSDPQVIAAAHEARELLTQTVLANRFRHQPGSGLSVELPEFNPVLRAVGRLADFLGKLV